MARTAADYRGRTLVCWVREQAINSAKQLREIVERNEAKAVFAAWILVSGLILEFWLAVGFHSGKTFVENWGPVVADFLVAGAVFSEIHFSGKASRAQRELQLITEERLTQALDRAAKAESDLVEFRTPRRSKLRPHIDRLSEELEKFARTKFDIGFGGGDGEQADLCWGIEDMLAKARWDQQHWGAISTGPVAINDRGPNRLYAGQVAAVNVEIHLDPDWRRSLIDAATALGHELNSLGIKTKIVNNNARSANVMAMHVLIGPKA
jgi:hypothetical protein